MLTNRSNNITLTKDYVLRYEHRVFVLVNIFVCAFAFTLNLKIIYQLIKKRILREKLSTKLLITLLLSDSLTALVIGCLFVTIINERSFQQYRENNITVAFVLGTLLRLSSISILLISADRLLAVVYPFIYEQKVTSKYIKVVLTLLFLYIFLDFTSTLFYRIYGDAIIYLPINCCLTISFIAITQILITIFNIILFTINRRHLKEISKSNSYELRVRLHKTLKSIRICFGLVISYFICYSAPLAKSFFSLTHQQFYDNEIMNVVASLCILANTIIDPLVYISINKDFKKAVQKIKRRISLPRTKNAEVHNS